MKLLKDIAQKLEDDCSYDESMAKHTSWGIGGRADLFYSPKSRKDLVYFLSSIDPNLPITWIGRGTNILVRDAGIRGVVISAKFFLKEIWTDPDEMFSVQFLEAT